jgi:hypothetical protein
VPTPQTTNTTTHWRSEDPPVIVTTQWTTPVRENLSVNLDKNFEDKQLKLPSCQSKFDCPFQWMATSALALVPIVEDIPDELCPQENGLFFCLICLMECLTQRERDNHCKFGHVNVIHVPLNNSGEYVMFPTMTTLISGITLILCNFFMFQREMTMSFMYPGCF